MKKHRGMAAAGGRESPTNSNKEEHWYTSPQGIDPAQRASKRGKIQEVRSRARDTYPDVYPSVISNMHSTCIVNVSCVPCILKMKNEKVGYTHIFYV